MPHVMLVNGDEHVAAEEQQVLVPVFSLRPAVHVHGGNDFVDGVRGRLPQRARAGAISERGEQGLGALTIWFALTLFIAVPVLQDHRRAWGVGAQSNRCEEKTDRGLRSRCWCIFAPALPHWR